MARRLTLCVLLIPVWASLLAVGGIVPAAAGNGWWEQQEEDRRERERDRAEREEARRQRQAERDAQRAERDQQRQQREQEREERQQREQERQAREEARELERQAREQAREERQSRSLARGQDRERHDEPREQRYERNEGRVSPVPFTDPAPVKTVQQPSTGEPSNGKSWVKDQDEERDEGSRGKPSNSNSDGGKSKQNGSAQQTAKEEGRDNSKDKDKNSNNNKSKNKDTDKRQKDDDDEEEGEPETVSVPEPEEPPRTLVEWLNRMDGTRKPSTPEPTVRTTAPAPAPVVEPVSVKTTNSNRESPASNPKATESKAESKNAVAVKSAQTTSSAETPRRIGFDDDVLRLGLARKRQVLASGLDQAGLSKVRAMGFKTIASAKSPGSATPVVSLTVPEGMSEGKAQEWLQQALPQARFGPNHVYHIYPAAEVTREASVAPGKNACRGADCFAKELLNWKPSSPSCASGVRIGVIDTSFDMSHPALKGRSHDLKDFRTSPIDAKSDWHGTAVLSVLAGDSASATPGLVPQAHFLLAATFGTGQDGQASADALSVLAALEWLDGKAHIINMSFSGPRNDEIELAIRAMAVKGVVFVAAAGNRGPNGPASYPAAYSDVIAVTAVAHDRRGYRHATHGDYVDMSAPGVDVFTALPFGKTGLRTGTSFAAPFVTGLLAAMPGARQGVMSKGEVLARISTTDLGPPGRDPVFGEGLPQVPERCDEIGGVASLPWSPEAQRMSLGGAGPAVSQSATRSPEPVAASAMGWAMGFAP